MGEQAALSTVGEVLCGLAPGRGHREDVTVFDATGLALHDIATAQLAVNKARASGRGRWLSLE